MFERGLRSVDGVLFFVLGFVLLAGAIVSVVKDRENWPISALLLLWGCIFVAAPFVGRRS